MPNIIVDITHEGSNSEVVVLSVRGYIDSTTTPELSVIIDHQIARGNYMFIVNLKGRPYYLVRYAGMLHCSIKI